ncbi:MAG: 4-hydroxy-tetrahydrodipicolinate reductase [Bacteroidia bacterium]|nr:MAG: 4-hydroxy-tetrahydrodipicolinate reductase [Bacteroidia bacterium]
MNIALIGYGKMGKEVEAVAGERGWTVALRRTSRSSPPSEADMRSIDVVIHFARADSLRQHVEEWSKAGKPMVVGTTGWGSDLDAMKRIIDTNGTGLVYGSNFSLGMQIFQRMVRRAGALIDRFPEYDAGIRETHHRHKADSPSGTALMLGTMLLEKLSRKSELVHGTLRGPVKPEQLPIASLRMGTEVGEHAVLFDSPADTIELVHKAKNRRGFALGALLAAEWIRGRTGIHTFDEVVSDLLDP